MVYGLSYGYELITFLKINAKNEYNYLAGKSEKW